MRVCESIMLGLVWEGGGEEEINTIIAKTRRNKAEWVTTHSIDCCLATTVVDWLFLDERIYICFVFWIDTSCRICTIEASGVAVGWMEHTFCCWIDLMAYCLNCSWMAFVDGNLDGCWLSTWDWWSRICLENVFKNKETWSYLKLTRRNKCTF